MLDFSTLISFKFIIDFSPIDKPLSPQNFKSNFSILYVPAEKSAQSFNAEVTIID